MSKTRAVERTKKVRKSRFSLQDWQIKCADIAFNNVSENLHRKGVITEELYNELLLESEYEMRDKYGARPVERDKARGS